jgi:hypothetical protein
VGVPVFAELHGSKTDATDSTTHTTTQLLGKKQAQSNKTQRMAGMIIHMKEDVMTR